MMSSEIVPIKPGQLRERPSAGKVYLVGAGPGDAELLTLKAIKAINSADMILFDHLVSEDIRQLFPASIPAVYVGKVKDHHSIPQDQLNKLLVEKATQGLNLCRLKGGDAFVFGRGGEEMLQLKQAGIEVELIPGITAAAGCTSYAGIPLTHRGLSQGCTFVTAHAEKELSINWSSLAQLDHTLVFYMGLSRAEMIADKLQACGQDGATPVALIENGCCPNQRVVRGQLSELPQLVMDEDVQSPALIVVGKVVQLSEQLDWFRTQAEQSLNSKFQNQKSSAQIEEVA